MLLSMGLQRVGHKLVTEQEQQYKQCLWLEMNISGHRLFLFFTETLQILISYIPSNLNFVTKLTGTFIIQSFKRY